ncbi:MULTISPECIES: hypothetical protein [unclassified Pseudonocardia]|uniref:hypothetical protein n=1 Tax=unclassified Pseudonocardia TaxID=2619320 RepID=UPI0001FFE882|nr:MULTISPECIES: hypothetical protein [unclassified Pseudonocardia]
MSAPMHLPRFLVRQRITLGVNRYDVHAANPDGSEGPLMAFAQQKRFAFKEEVVFWADDSRRRRVFSFKARQAMDVRAQHDVHDEHGQLLGTFGKKFGASLFRSTWRLESPGLAATGQERSLPVALLRRVFDDVPFPFHFDFTEDGGGPLVMTSDRKRSIRDRYDVAVPDPRIDFRLAASVAVALDALQSR